MSNLANERNVVLNSDHADSCLLLETLFQTRLGCRVNIASDFTEALKTNVENDFQQNRKYSLSLVSFANPGGEG